MEVNIDEIKGKATPNLMVEGNNYLDVLKQMRTTGFLEGVKLYTQEDILEANFSKAPDSILDIIIHANEQSILPNLKYIQDNSEFTNISPVLKKLKNMGFIINPTNIEIFYVFKKLNNKNFKFDLHECIKKEICTPLKGNKGGSASIRKMLKKPRGNSKGKRYMALTIDESEVPAYHALFKHRKS